MSKRRPKAFWDGLLNEWVHPPGPGRPRGSRSSDLSGQTFRHLTVLERVEDAPGSKAQYRCACDCGREATVRGDNLASGRTVSCGHVGHGRPYDVIGPLQAPTPVPADWRERGAAARAAHDSRERRRNGL